MRKKVIFRADGNSEIGLGHVIRSLALADMIGAEFECIFAIQQPSDYLRSEIEKICDQLIILPECAKDDPKLNTELAHYLSGREIVVLDGYKFQTSYQEYLKDKGSIVICIDDIHAYHFVADAIINHAGGVCISDYSASKTTRFFLGLKYALVRPEFLKPKQERREFNSIKNLFINMGGADPGNDTCKVLRQILRYSYFECIHVVTGSAYRYHGELKSVLENDLRIVHHENLNAKEIAALMQNCGVAICPPSSVAFEYAMVNGLLFLKQIAENQTRVKSYFLERKLAFDFDHDFVSILDSNLESIYSLCINRQQVEIDGNSSVRFCKIFNELNKSSYVSLRNAESTDVFLCYNWINDPEVRKQSYNMEPIAFDVHEQWFQKKLSDTNCNLFIVEYQGKPIGQIRFDGSSEKLLSYLISSEMRGKGLGSIVLLKGVERLLKEVQGVERILGFVKQDNIASCKSFEKAGFIANMDKQSTHEDSNLYELLSK